MTTNQKREIEIFLCAGINALKPGEITPESAIRDLLKALKLINEAKTND